MIKIRPTRLKALENLTQICAWSQSETETFINYLSKKFIGTNILEKKYAKI